MWKLEQHLLRISEMEGLSVETGCAQGHLDKAGSSLGGRLAQELGGGRLGRGHERRSGLERRRRQSRLLWLARLPIAALLLVLALQTTHSPNHVILRWGHRNAPLTCSMPLLTEWEA